MRKLTRSILATTAVAGLLAVPVAGAGAASDSTTTQLTLAGVEGTIAVNAPGGDTTTPNDLGSMDIVTGSSATANSLGNVNVADTTTGLLRETVLTVDTGLTDTTLGFCQDAGGLGDGTIDCSTDPTEQILKANVTYDFNTVAVSGDGTGTVTEADGALGTATATFASLTTGAYELDWTPIISITLLGTEAAGTYYGEIVHSATGVNL